MEMAEALQGENGMIECRDANQNWAGGVYQVATRGRIRIQRVQSGQDQLPLHCVSGKKISVNSAALNYQTRPWKIEYAT